jgi:hypothetical protein
MFQVMETDLSQSPQLADGRATDGIPKNLDRIPPGAVLAGWLSAIDVDRVSGYDRVVVLRAHQRLATHYAAQTYRDMAAITEAVRDELFDVPGETEMAAEAEIRVALTWTRRLAESELSFALDIQQRLPRVFTLLEGGTLDVRRAKVIVDGTVHLSDGTAREVVDMILDDAPSLTTGQLRARIRKLCTSLRSILILMMQQPRHDTSTGLLETPSPRMISERRTRSAPTSMWTFSAVGTQGQMLRRAAERLISESTWTPCPDSMTIQANSLATGLSSRMSHARLRPTSTMCVGATRSRIRHPVDRSLREPPDGGRRHPSEGPWRRSMQPASSPVAACQPPTATSTTDAIGPREVRPRSATSDRCASTTTASSTKRAGGIASAPMGRPYGPPGSVIHIQPAGRLRSDREVTYS